MSSVIIAGNTSGTVTLQAPAVAGTTTIDLPASSGTLVNTAPGASGNVLTSDGTDWVSQALPAGGVTSLNGQTGAITNTDLDVIGSYFMSSDDTTLGARTIGSTYAGSTLLKINSAGTRVSAGLSGTWRMLGANENSANTSRLYVRIS